MGKIKSISNGLLVVMMVLIIGKFIQGNDGWSAAKAAPYVL